MANPPRLLWTNPEKTIFVDSFDGGRVLSVATREDSDAVWGPPTILYPDPSTRAIFGELGGVGNSPEQGNSV